MTLDQLHKDLEKAKKQLAAAGAPDEKTFAENKIKKIEAQIASFDDARGGKPIKPVKKKSAGKKMKKESAVKKDADTKKIKMIEYKGETYREDDPEYCEMLKKDLADRRKKRASSDKKVKTKSISFKIADDVTGGIEKAINNVSAASIAANPKKYIAKFTHVSKITEAFLRQLKDILGDDYSAAEMKRPLSAINTSIERIKNKYSRKK